ncbi:unnamed protein product [Microthlaspi erraticum]|uniref:Uncharacterized protein n=1 Tax=Microthlaspi erraticum TaxID=1685480 RepID=A0A6D2I9K2_9BRAS|nr:unnamed protein product [Microthlaspi erraticum]
MPLNYAIWKSLEDITFVLKTGPQPAERTRPDRKGIGFARPSPGPSGRTTAPSEPGGNGPRSTENITSRPTPTADHIPCTVDPSSANKKPTYAVSTILGPFHLNRLVEDLGHYKYSFLASLEERAAQEKSHKRETHRELPLEGSSIVLLLSHCFLKGEDPFFVLDIEKLSKPFSPYNTMISFYDLCLFTCMMIE